MCLTLFRDLGRQRPGVVPAIPGYLICIIHLYIDHRKPPGGIYFRIVSTVLNTMEICKATVPHQCIKTGSFEYKYRAERSRKFGANALLLFIVLHSVFHLRLHIPHRVSAANGNGSCVLPGTDAPYPTFLTIKNNYSRKTIYDTLNKTKSSVFIQKTELYWSELLDSNQRPLEPHSSAIPNFAKPGYFVCPRGLAYNNIYSENVKRFFHILQKFFGQHQKRCCPFFPYSPGSCLMTLPMFHRRTTPLTASCFSSSVSYSR